MSTHAPTIYPGAIAQAISTIDECDLFRGMPDGYIWVLIRIIKKINLRKLSTPIQAKRETLAAEAGCSPETVYRVLKWLADRELIERDQKSHAKLRGSRSPIVVTRKLLDALFLTDRKFQGKAPVTQPAPSQSADRAEAGAWDRNKFERVDGKTLPKDLAWLVRRGVRATGVLDLMKRARVEAKQQLQDVVAAAGKYLDGLNGREIYAYIRKLLKTGIDFGHQLREAGQVARSEQEAEHLRRKAEALDGQTFVRMDGALTVTVEGGMLVEVRDGKRGARPMCQGFLDAIDSGRLTPGACG